MMETDMANHTEFQTFDFNKYKNEEGAFDPSKFNTKRTKLLSVLGTTACQMTL